jgi:hypothetical protein
MPSNAQELCTLDAFYADTSCSALFINTPSNAEEFQTQLESNTSRSPLIFYTPANCSNHHFTTLLHTGIPYPDTPLSTMGFSSNELFQNTPPSSLDSPPYLNTSFDSPSIHTPPVLDAGEWDLFGTNTFREQNLLDLRLDLDFGKFPYHTNIWDPLADPVFVAPSQDMLNACATTQ